MQVKKFYNIRHENNYTYNTAKNACPPNCSCSYIFYNLYHGVVFRAQHGTNPFQSSIYHFKAYNKRYTKNNQAPFNPVYLKKPRSNQYHAGNNCLYPAILFCLKKIADTCIGKLYIVYKTAHSLVLIALFAEK